MQGVMSDRVQASLKNKSYVWLDYIELRTRLNQFEILENMKLSIQINTMLFYMKTVLTEIYV